jgi:GGDEF domain-containing protein
MSLIEKQSTHVLQPAHDLVRLIEAIDQSVADNYRMPCSGAFLAIGVYNISLIKHLSADAVLMEIAARLKKVMRHGDVIGRISEDHLGIVLSVCRPDNIAGATKRFLARVTSIDSPRGSLDVTLSIASVAFPDQGMTSSGVIKRAEETLVEAMRAGPPSQPEREPEGPGVVRQLRRQG